MTEPRSEIRTASDGYPIHVSVWDATAPLRARVVVIHGVQSHGGWYHNLGRILSQAGFEVHIPDRRGSGANTKDRGDTPSARRLIDDIAELIRDLRNREPRVPSVLGAISWGGKTAIITAADHPETIDALAVICPGLTPRVGVSTGERLRIALAFLTNKRKLFPIPLSDPALFTGEAEGQKFIATDPLGLRFATARLLVASTLLDRLVKSALPRVKAPTLLMLSGRDRIVDNAKTLEKFERLGCDAKRVIEYPDAHHTLEFEPDASRYALDLIDWIEKTLGANLGAGAHLHS